MNKLIGYILSPIFYLVFLLWLLIFQPIQWVCYKAFGYKAHKKSVDILNFFLSYSQWVLFNRIHFINEENLPLGRPIIFTANHQSMFDIPPLIYFLRKYHAKFISKIELTKGIPSISFNLKYGGGANINRKDNKQAISEVIQLAKRMEANNWSTVIFPEGTRSKDGQIKQFQYGGITTILKYVPHALVVPVAIENSWKIVRFGKLPLGIGLNLRWTVLKPIEPQGQSPEEVVHLAENQIREKLGQPKI